jgi:hypothetical protein
VINDASTAVIGHVIVDSGGGSNASVGATGSAVPASGTLIMGNTGGTARGFTGTNTAGSTYAMDVNIAGGAALTVTGTTFGAALPATGLAAGFYDGTNQQAARVMDADTGGGTHFTLETVLMQPGSGGPTAVTFVADAANQAAVSTNPVPGGCVYFSGGNTLANGQVGHVASDNKSEQIFSGSGAAGTPAGGILSVQGVSGMTALTVVTTGGSVESVTQGTSPWVVQVPDVANIVSAQATVDDAGDDTICAARSGRVRSTIVQQGSVSVFIGPTGVSTSTGTELIGIPGASITLLTTAGIHGVTASGSSVVACLEEY